MPSTNESNDGKRIVMVLGRICTARKPASTRRWCSASVFGTMRLARYFSRGLHTRVPFEGLLPRRRYMAPSDFQTLSTTPSAWTRHDAFPVVPRPCWEELEALLHKMASNEATEKSMAPASPSTHVTDAPDGGGSDGQRRACSR